MTNVIYIAPVKTESTIHKIRCAAYCRVSSSSDDQLHSYDVLPFAHRFSFPSCHKKSASCDINSILPQLADFLQTFFQRLSLNIVHSLR